jgi:hypothetical protein
MSGLLTTKTACSVQKACSDKWPNPQEENMAEEQMAEIRGAVARGWCHPANSSKVMDIDLAEAISQEVYKLIERHYRAAQTAESTPPYDPEGLNAAIRAQLRAPAPQKDGTIRPHCMGTEFPKK